MMLADTWNFASKLTAKRIRNAHKIYSSYQRARRSGIPEISGMPISMAVEPTTACNLRCPECPSGLRSFTRPTGKLATSLFDTLLADQGDTLCYLTLYFQGEPFLHSGLTDMISKASQLGIYTATSTNAHFLTEKSAIDIVQSGLDRIIISIDGTTQESYEAYRKGGDFDKVLEGTQTLLRVRRQLKSSTPHIIWQFLVVAPNEHEIPAIQRLARTYQVDQLVLKSAQLYDYEFGNALMPTNEKYSRYKKGSDGRYQSKTKFENECWKMWHSAVMTWDGKIVPCCFDKDAHYPMGNLNEAPMSEIWNSNKYHQFRKQLFTSRQEIEMCRNCSEGAQVWV